MSHITNPIFFQKYDIVFYVFQGIMVQEILLEQIYRSFEQIYRSLYFSFFQKVAVSIKKNSFQLCSNMLRNWSRLPSIKLYIDYIHKIGITSLRTFM